MCVKERKYQVILSELYWRKFSKTKLGKEYQAEINVYLWKNGKKFRNRNENLSLILDDKNVQNGKKKVKLP